jgi:pimeloyl-ACP methyl ester carboxylesterase
VPTEQLVLFEEQVFPAAGQHLAATTLYPPDRRPPDILHLHGLGVAASRHVIRYLLDPLAAAGHAALTFDFSGNGESTGVYLQGSLRQRYQEALAVGGRLDADRSPVLIGTSMGAHLAAWAVPVLRPRALIFFCPAAYPAAATDVRFTGYLANTPGGSPQDAALVRPGYSADSPAFAGIAEFTGDLLVIAGRRDEVVPAEVVEGYLRHARRARSHELIWLADCGHLVHRWLPDRPRLKARVLHAMRRVIALGSAEPPALGSHA